MSVFKKIVSFVDIYTMHVTVFISGAVVMIFELVGSRILAPYLGNSIFIWSSLIGVVLGSLSLGYYLGGKLADRRPEHNVLAAIFLGAAFFVMLTSLLDLMVLLLIQQFIPDVRLGAVLATLILFAPATVFLGMVTPYAVRLTLKDINISGSTVGNLYAFSTVGSIFGTFLTGFFLLSYLGSKNILVLLAALLFFTAFFIFWKSGHRVPKASLFIFLFFIPVTLYTETAISTTYVADRDTQYNRIVVYDIEEDLTQRPIRLLVTAAHAAQSGMYLDGDDLLFRYTKFYRLGKYINPDIKNALMIGGAGFSYPKDFLKRHPDDFIDVVEIDPGITRVAEDFFELEENSHLKIFHEDGRIFLNTTKKKYDVMYIDAFLSSVAIPYQLTTVEAIQKMYDVLNPKGAVFINVVGSVGGDTGKFLRAEHATYKEVFPHVLVFLVNEQNSPEQVQSVILAAFKEKPIINIEDTEGEYQEFLNHLWLGGIEKDMPILTDDFAPVEQYNRKLEKELVRQSGF